MTDNGKEYALVNKLLVVTNGWINKLRPSNYKCTVNAWCQMYAQEKRREAPENSAHVN